jgi:hypothetical protein
MAVINVMARSSGLPVQLELLLGSMITGRAGLGSWILGFAMHIGAGAAFALVYAAAFEAEGHASAARGARYGLLHALVSGLALTLMPSLHPLVPEVLRAPGPFMLGLGWLGALAFVMLHVIYGAIVGFVYGPIRHSTAVEVRP